MLNAGQRHQFGGAFEAVAHPNMPSIMLTRRRGEESDEFAGLITGADDYRHQTFSTTELMARVASVLSVFAGLKEDKMFGGDIVIPTGAPVHA